MATIANIGEGHDDVLQPLDWCVVGVRELELELLRGQGDRLGAVGEEQLDERATLLLWRVVGIP